MRVAGGLALVAPERGVRRQHHPRMSAHRRIERRRLARRRRPAPHRRAGLRRAPRAGRRCRRATPRETFTRNAPRRIRASAAASISGGAPGQRRAGAARPRPTPARTLVRGRAASRRSATARRAQDRGRTPGRRSASRAPARCLPMRPRPTIPRVRRGWPPPATRRERVPAAARACRGRGTARGGRARAPSRGLLPRPPRWSHPARCATQMPAVRGRLEVDVVDADRDRRDDPQPLGEALDHGGVTGLSPTSSASAPSAAASTPAGVVATAARTSNPSARSRSGPSPHVGLHRVNIHSRCRISNHWCILGSGHGRGKRCCAPLVSMVRIARGFVEHATTRRAPQAIGGSSHGRSLRSRASHGRASSSSRRCSCCSSTRSARSTSSRSRSTGAGRSTTTAVSTTSCTSTRSPGASCSASARPCSAC